MCLLQGGRGKRGEGERKVPSVGKEDVQVEERNEAREEEEEHVSMVCF